MKKLNILVLVFLAIISCKEDDTNTDPQFGTLDLQFVNTINSNPIVLNTESYTNLNNETYSISELKYIISNIVLIKENGEEFAYPIENSYFLINEEITSSKNISLNNININEYAKIRFGFGIDQSNYPLNGMANFIPTAEESGMLWSWSAGYKFLKFEGSFASQEGTTSDFILHIGSHGTTLDNYKEITLDISNPLIVEGETTSNLSIEADVAKIFDSANSYSLEQKSDVQVDPINAPILAENVETMFTATNSTNY